MNKQFWLEALKGGTLVGLVSVALALVNQFAGENTTLVNIVSIVSTVVTILLVFGLTRKFAAQHSAEEGFSYGRGVAFILAMMIFVGILNGFYTSIMANFVIRGELLEMVDMTAAQMQDMIPAESFDKTYQAMRSTVTNPFVLTLSSVVSNLLFGLLMGLCLSALTRRQPDIFASDSNENSEN